MKIILDNIIFSLQKIGGISILWGELIDKMKKDNISFLEYEKSDENYIRQNINIDSDKIINKNKADKVKIRRYINPYLPTIKDKFIFVSSYYRICRNKNALNVTIVHDFTYEYFFNGLSQKIHHLQKKQAIKKADLVICISNNTKKDLLKFFPEVDENKIEVVYNGVSNLFKPVDFSKDFRLISSNLYYLNEKKNILFVGQRGGYKNFNKVVEAYTNLGNNYHLLIVGQKLNAEEIKMLKNNNIASKNYTVLENLSVEHLNLIYNLAYVLLYPSSYEGFGIPIVEAMKTGLPVIAYNSSSIPEVLGDAGILLKSLASQDIVSAIKSLEDEQFRNDIIESGFKQSALFSWVNTFEQYHLLFKKLFDSNR